ncbi:MAG: metallophosphoesterase [Planctomycetota bacterium]|jgi:UDP-2,3-diacylglucosamine pyrophosphatase LpxH
MAKKKKTLFISDVHMGAGKEWDWFNIKEEGPYLISFFEYVQNRQSTQNDIEEVTLLGDIFDLWVCPHDEDPHTFDDIVKAQKDVIAAIVKMAETVPTCYINGNHDYRVSSKHIENAFKRKIKHYGNVYRRGNVWAEHGHKHALFNCPDFRNGGYLRLPLGYYITRLHTSLGDTRKAKFNLITQMIDESFQALGPEKLPESVLDALKDAIEKTDSNRKVIDFNMKGICSNQEFTDVRARYQNLFDDWRKAEGYWKSFQMIMCELNCLGTVADQLCRDGVDIVIFGHSHDTKMDKDSLFVKDRIYANCGYWCGLGEKDKIQDHAHFVETDGETVSLCSFKDGKAIEKKSLKL